MTLPPESSASCDHPTVELNGSCAGLATTTCIRDQSTIAYDPTTETLVWTFLATQPGLRLILLELPVRAICAAAMKAEVLTQPRSTVNYRSFRLPASCPPRTLLEMLEAPSTVLLRIGAKLQMRDGTSLKIPSRGQLQIANATPHNPHSEYRMMHLTVAIGEHARFDVKVRFSHMLLALATLRVLNPIAAPPGEPVVVELPRSMR